MERVLERERRGWAVGGGGGSLISIASPDQNGIVSRVYSIFSFSST